MPYDYSGHQGMLEKVDQMLQNRAVFNDTDIEELHKIKKEILDSIQKDLMDDRRKKLNKILNIPEPPMSEEKRKKLDRVKEILNSRKA
jgi:C4-type Zn-finger protein